LWFFVTSVATLEPWVVQILIALLLLPWNSPFQHLLPLTEGTHHNAPYSRASASDLAAPRPCVQFLVSSEAKNLNIFHLHQ
jgi:hypothetical protein